MTTRLMTGALAFFLLGGALHAEIEDTLDALIAALASEKFEARKQAREELTALGSPAIPALRAALKDSDDPEIRVLAGKILQDIAAADRTSPSLVTINVDDQPIEEVVKMLSEQIEGSIELDPEEEKKRVTLNLQRKPLWEALREIQVQTGYRLREPKSPGTILLDLDSTECDLTAPSHQAGPFLFVAKDIVRNSSVKFGANAKTTNQLTLNVQFVAEPKIVIIGAAHTQDPAEVRDGKGNLLAQRKIELKNVHWRSIQGGDIERIGLRIPEPDGPIKKLTKVRGVFPVRIQAKAGRVEVPRILDAKGRSYQSKHWEIKIEKADWDGSNAEIKIAAKLLKKDAGKGGPTSLHYDRFVLLDQDGEPFRRSGYSGGGGGKSWSATFNFRANRQADNQKPKQPIPAKFVYTYAAEMEERLIPFEFENLEVP